MCVYITNMCINLFSFFHLISFILIFSYFLIFTLFFACTDHLYHFLFSNPVFRKIDCGPPIHVADANMFYTSSTYNSEVIYTCPDGKTLKSVCKEDSKWSSVVSSCEGNVNSYSFVASVLIILFCFV